MKRVPYFFGAAILPIFLTVEAILSIGDRRPLPDTEFWQPEIAVTMAVVTFGIAGMAFFWGFLLGKDD